MFGYILFVALTCAVAYLLGAPLWVIVLVGIFTALSCVAHAYRRNRLERNEDSSFLSIISDLFDRSSSGGGGGGSHDD